MGETHEHRDRGHVRSRNPGIAISWGHALANSARHSRSEHSPGDIAVAKAEQSARIDSYVDHILLSASTEKERCAQCEWLSAEAGHEVFGCADSLSRSGWIENQVSALPALNFTGTNAAAVLRLLGEEPASEGEWSATDLDRVIRTALTALNDRAAISAEVVPASTSCGATRLVEDGNVIRIVRGSLCMDFGSDAEGIVRRLHEVAKLCIEARKIGWRVVWR